MIYFDNGATTFPKPKAVIEKTVEFMEKYAANPGRGGHKIGLESGRVVFEARYEIAELFNIANPMNIAFTKNASEAINIGIKGFLKEKDHVISSMMEHNSVSRPIASLSSKGIEHSFVKCRNEGFLDLEEFKNSFKENTRLVAITHASNVTGTVNDLKKIGEICKEKGAILLVDAAQSAGVFDIDVEAMNIGMLCCPGHKGLYGPMGTGFIYVREDIKLATLMEGGTGSSSESLEHPSIMPDSLEVGTVNAVGIAGLLEGVKFVKEIGVESIRLHEQNLVNLCIDGLKKIDKIKIYGPEDFSKRAGVVAFNIGDLPSTDVSYILDSAMDIAVRSGLHCASLAHQTLGTLSQGIVRASFSYFNTENEVNEFVEGIKKLAEEI